MGRVDNRPVTKPSAPAPAVAKSAAPGAAKPAADGVADLAAKPAPQAPGDSLTRSSVGQGQAMPTVSLDAPPKPILHTVARNETLSSIAKKHLGNQNLYMEIFNLNRDILRHPNQIHAGMVLRLPGGPEPDVVVRPDDKPVAETKPVRSPEASLGPYRAENPLSYVTLGQQPVASDKTRLLGPDSLFAKFLKPVPSHTPTGQGGIVPPLAPMPSHGDLSEIVGGREQTLGATVSHEDAVKVNKRFDISPKLTTNNLAKEFAPWAREVAGILRANQAGIQLPTQQGQPVTLTADKLEALAAKPIGEAADYFRKELGIALFNTLWAIDDVASDMKHDPYYSEVKATPKTVDLAAVADRFNLCDDKQSYLAKTAAHRHKQIPILLQGAATTDAKAPARTPAQILTSLSKHFNAKGALTKPAEFEAEVYQLLENQTDRRHLVQHFGLDSAENLNAMVPGITSEGGMGDSQRTYNSYFAVGSVMLNRALGRNLRLAAAHQAQGKPAASFKPFTMSQVLFEPQQFEITWRAMPGTKNKTFYQYSQGLNQAFLNHKLGGGQREAYETAYEAARDLVSGMHQLQAEVNGTPQKNSGRSTGALFYFNQSRSQDFSQSSSAAVSLVDSNNTHVFFKEWDQRAYFRD